MHHPVRAGRTVPRVHCLISERDDLTVLPALAEVGVDGFQVRAKSYDDRALFTLTQAVLDAVRPHRAVVVVNDRLDVALAAGADGVHLGADDLSVTAARRVAPELMIGATCRSRGDVEDAAIAGADYAGFGPVFATGSKEGLPDPLGIGAVSAAAGVLPLIAIGGITADSAAQVRAVGAHGVAVIAAIWQPPDPVAAAKELVVAVR